MNNIGKSNGNFNHSIIACDNIATIFSLVSSCILSHIPTELTAGLKQSLSNLSDRTILDNIHHHFE